MIKNSFRVVYDSGTDTMYVTAQEDVTPAMHDAALGQLSRGCFGDDALVGVSVASFNAYWNGRFDALPGRSASRSVSKRSAAAR